MTIDHYLPRSAGGPTEIFNLVACCRRCNKEKHDRVPPDVSGVQIALFQKAVMDGIIRPDQSRIKDWDPASLSAIDTVYTNAEGTVFEGGGYRYLVCRHQVKKAVRYRLHGE